MLETEDVLVNMTNSVLSTSIELNCSAGLTLFGGKILRYSKFFISLDEERKKEKRPAYQLFVQKEINNQIRFMLKKDSEVDNATIDVYVDMPGSLKIGEYYSIKIFGVKYSKSYFKKLQDQEKTNKKNYII